MDEERNVTKIRIGGASIDVSRPGNDSGKTTNSMDDAVLVDEVPQNSHKFPRFYRQDVVRHKRTCSLGIVNDVAGDSDSDSSADDFDEEDENEEGCDRNSGRVDDDANDSDFRVSENSSIDNLSADQIRVIWLDNTAEVQNADDVVLLDRGFLHGDYVASALDPTGQVGVVLDLNIAVDLLASDGSILKNISTRDIRRVREFSVGDYVVYGPWLGRIDGVLDNVTVQMDDGSSCRVLGADPLRLKPISKNNLDEDSQFPYYPGQRVKASSSSVFKNSKWLSGLWRANKLEGTVSKVTVGSLFIYWIASAGFGPDSSTSPPEKQSPKNLKLLSCFAHANWQLGDYCMVPSSVWKNLSVQNNNPSKMDSYATACVSEESDEIKDSMDIDQQVELDRNRNQSKASPDSSSCCSSTANVKDSNADRWALHRKKMRRVVVRKDKKSRKNEENIEKAHMIVNIKTKVDIAWQDGTIGHGMDSTLLIPIDSPGDHEFVAEQYVVEKASDDTDGSSEPRRCGVIRSVNAKERTARVRWLKAVERPEDPREFDAEEIVSVYELEGHPDYDYTYGDVVVRLSPITSSESVTTDDVNIVYSGEYFEDCKSNNSDNQISDNRDDKSGGLSNGSSHVSWVGNITGLRNGDIEVTWADGMVSTVGPQAIFVVGRDDDGDDDSITAGSEVSNGGASWETVSSDDETDTYASTHEDVLPLSCGERNGESECSNSARNSSTLIPSAAIDFVNKLAGIFSRKRNVLQNTSEELQNLDLSTSPSQRNSRDDLNSQICDISHGNESTEPVDDEVPNASETSCKLDAENVEVTLILDSSSHFKRFDTTSNPSDHYFLGSSGQVSNPRKWLKKVQQDWSILQNNLPDGIYVRVYEDRMDLIRAVIVGACGTPYQDGLFFFDFYLPSDYPDVPPLAHYHSGGWRINPNLYEEGKVCLSLLNTWTGRGNEVWDAKSSSILQVLVSLQGLVLNSRPYFNEAGYDKQVGTAEGEKNSLSYNENTFLLNCKTMMFLMRRPPKDFEDLIREHFRRRGKYIMMACDAYMKGCLIGSLNGDVSVAASEDATSLGFKLMLAKIMPKLRSSLDSLN